MSLIARQATPADIPALMRMKAALLASEDFLHVGVGSVDDWQRDGFGPAPKFQARIAEVDGVAAGMAIFSKRGFPGWGGSAFFLHDLYVDEAWRRRGCARALMAQLAIEAQTQSAAFIELTVHASNNAREFYERIGFAHISHCMTYVGAQPVLNALAESATNLRTFPVQPTPENRPRRARNERPASARRRARG